MKTISYTVSYTILAILAAGLLSACEAPSSQADAPAGEQLDALAEQYFEEQLADNTLMATYIGNARYNDSLPNTFSAAYRERALRREKDFLGRVSEIPVDALNEERKITREVFIRDRRMAIEAARFPEYMIPVTHFFSLPGQFPGLGSGKGAQPFETVADYDNWLSRMADFHALMEQATRNFRQGAETGVTLPQVIVARMVEQLGKQVVANPEDSVFWMPIENMPDTFPGSEKARLRQAYHAAIENHVVPAYRTLRDYLRDEYMPVARTTTGLVDLPGGEEWYRHFIRRHTTLDLGAEELHEFGLDEVRRNLAAMREVMRDEGFEGSLQEWFEHVRTADRFYFDSEEEVLQGYRDIETRMDQAIARLFDFRPDAGFEVRAIESYRAKGSPRAFYQQPSPDGSRPGLFYVNTYDLRSQPIFGMQTLFMHEAIPGHHFQRGLQVAMDGLPRFRRFGGYSAYTEGWALYAETLGRELGFYEDPMQWYGHLTADQLRAMRLVVDTGIHAMGWTRDQAIAFMQENSSMAMSNIKDEVDRYIVVPGQALSFKVGQRQFRAMREQARTELGDRFDVHEYHRVVLESGPLPLDVLEAKVRRWIESSQ